MTVCLSVIWGKKAGDTSQQVKKVPKERPSWTNCEEPGRDAQNHIVLVGEVITKVDVLSGIEVICKPESEYWGHPHHFDEDGSEAYIPELEMPVPARHRVYPNEVANYQNLECLFYIGLSFDTEAIMWACGL